MLKENSSNNTKYLKVHCQKVNSSRNGKLQRLCGSFPTLFGDQEKRFKIWGLPDYLGELTALV